MAITTLPLMSLAAKGSIGGALTFARLKGQNVVRILVTPANPQTAGQTAQRTKLTDAVGEWHTAGLTAADVAAYNRWAAASFRKLSGYNLFTKERINYKNDGGTVDPGYNVLASGEAADHFDLHVDYTSGGSVKVFLGLTKTSQPTEYSMDDDADNTYSDEIGSLAASTTYYYYVQFTDAASKVYRSGLYTVDTTA